MSLHDTLVSIGLPVRNGERFLEGAMASVLSQDHGNLELVISDNASDDATERICRSFARSDRRVRYYRQEQNIGLVNNFLRVQRLAGGEYFKWMGHDDWLAATYLSRCLEPLTQDQRLILVTTQQAYVSEDGRLQTRAYTHHQLRSDQPVERFAEMLRLLNESHLLLDPLYGVMRRASVMGIPRTNMLREDETFAAKLALTGPFEHISEVLAHRRSGPFIRLPQLARRLGVPTWHAKIETALECRELVRHVREAELTSGERRHAFAAIARMYLRRHARTAGRRARKFGTLTAAAAARGAAHLG